MSDRFRNIFIAVFMFLLLLPFLVLRDIFPFMRQAMFARPYEEFHQVEPIQIFARTDKNIYLLIAKDFNLNDTQYQYLIRNHFYRNTLPLLAKTLGETLPDSIQSISVYVTDSTRIQSKLIYTYEINH